MTDVEYEEQKARVEALIAAWVHTIGLAWWTITFGWDRSPCKDDDETTKTFFHVSTDWRYMDSAITAYLPSIALIDDDRLERSFVHELMHIIVNELRGTNHTPAHAAREERVATMLAKGFIWLRDAQRCEQPHIGDGTVQTVTTGTAS